jgi:ribosome modulation factor
MRDRCEKPHTRGYKYYGGKGVSICPEWATYVPFRDWARANGYSEGLTIDRLDSDGDYSPGNCEWVTHAENLRRMWENRKGTQP